MRPLRVRPNEGRRASHSATRSLATCVALALAGCSSGDTILALNVSSADDVGLIRELRVTVTQRGSAPVEVRFAPPLAELDDDAGQAIEPNFFHRIELPSGWREAPAEVAVTALGPAGVPPLDARAEVEIEPGEATAVFVELERARPDAGAGDANAGGDGSSGDAGAGDAANDGAAGDAGDASSGG